MGNFHSRIVMDSLRIGRVPMLPIQSLLKIHALLRFGNIHWICHKESIGMFSYFITTITSFMCSNGQELLKKYNKRNSDEEFASSQSQCELNLCTSSVSIRKIHRSLLYRVQHQSVMYSFLIKNLPPIIHD